MRHQYSIRIDRSAELRGRWCRSRQGRFGLQVAHPTTRTQRQVLYCVCWVCRASSGWSWRHAFSLETTGKDGRTVATNGGSNSRKWWPYIRSFPVYRDTSSASLGTRACLQNCKNQALIRKWHSGSTYIGRFVALVVRIATSRYAFARMSIRNAGCKLCVKHWSGWEGCIRIARWTPYSSEEELHH